MRVSVVTPDASVYDGEAGAVTLQALDGLFGILAGHAPLIARLGHGVATVTDGAKKVRVAVYGGFVKVQDDVVTVLAGGASEKSGEVAAARKAHEDASAAVAAAREAKQSPVEIEAAQEKQRRARAFLDLFA